MVDIFDRIWYQRALAFPIDWRLESKKAWQNIEYDYFRNIITFE